VLVFHKGGEDRALNGVICSQFGVCTRLDKLN
jgi:hypothetical protein